MQLSERLAAVARLAAGAERLADIGTDHAYLPIYLSLYQKIESAIAMDVNSGPLLRAQEHIRQYGLENRIQTRLSDGLEKLSPGEADTVVIAGMGGALTVRILASGQEKLSEVRTLVLQPQSEIFMVRRFLHQNGWQIAQEDMAKDGGKYYPMMRAQRGAQEAWQDFEYRYGRLLIRKKNPCLKEFLDREEQTYRSVLANLGGRGGAAQEGRKRAEKELFLIREAKTCMAQSSAST